ncbi:MAG TPA: ATP-binding protein [Roseiflexaceae bacterium]|nr:ATP-binding protein [Roseiflexaceae bacterium]
MIRRTRQSLLVRLLGVYLLFVAVVLGTGYAVNLVMQQQLRTDVHAADLSLAQAIAGDVDSKLRGARESLSELSQLDEVRGGDSTAMAPAFRAFKAARNDVDRVYWFDSIGIMRVSIPANVRTQGSDFSQRRLFQQARTAAGPITEAGIVDLTTYQAVAAIAQPVRDRAGQLLGVLALNLSLNDFSASLRTIVDEQADQQKPLIISLVDNQGLLIASAEQERLLQPMLDELPGLAEALAGRPATAMAPGPQRQEWLYSAVPVTGSGWAVVVQRPAANALATVVTFQTWLLVMVGLFALGGLLFWVYLLHLVIRPLHRLAAAYRAIRLGADPATSPTASLIQRSDEVGGLARVLSRLESDVTTRLAELQTLLDTSKVVVGTLDPQAVGAAIIHEVQRLVDVQAAAVFVPDDAGVLRVLASQGRSKHYNNIRLSIDDRSSSAVRALREARPVQMVADASGMFPPLSYAEGFRAVLAIPIQSPHAGGVVLVVHRTQPRPFSDREVNLLMTFANYAALAWEHAELYERSDVRLREERQTLAAIMRSMSDGLVLASVDGQVLYTNPGAIALTGCLPAELEHGTIEHIHGALRAVSARPTTYDQDRARAEAGAIPAWVIETGGERRRQAIQLRLFDVRDEAGSVIGRGLLLQDVTREQEIDQFKTTLLAAVGHELRTPLAVIKMHASTLLQADVVWSPADQRQFVQEMSDEADQLAQLVSNLLDLSRLEAGLLQLARAPSQIDQLIARTVRRLHDPIPRLTVVAPPDLPSLDVDQPRIEVVIHNLLTNALAYGNGTVRIAAEKCDPAIVIRVTDDGPGIAPDELPHLFERFYRAARGQQRRSGGIGLGLAICKAFVEAHGGRIWAESSAQGTTFAFSLPIDAADPADRDEAVLARQIDDRSDAVALTPGSPPSALRLSPVATGEGSA